MPNLSYLLSLLSYVELFDVCCLSFCILGQIEFVGKCRIRMKYMLKGVDGIRYGRVGKYLGGGVEGEVYEYGVGRVVKVLEGRFGSYEDRIKIYERLRMMRRVATIFGWGRLEEGWWVEMERLYQLPKETREMVNGWRFEKKRMSGDVGLFFEWLDRLPKRIGLRYVDVHGGNVMLGAGGELKVCDLDGFRIAEVEDIMRLEL